VIRSLPGRSSVSILSRLLSTMDILCGPGPSLKGLAEAFQELIGNCKALWWIYFIFLKKFLKIIILIFIFSGKIVQGKCFRIISTVSPVKLYCCYGVIMVLTVAVIALSVALSSKWLIFQIMWHFVHIHMVSYTYWPLWPRHCGKGSGEITLEIPVLWELRF
jgi:hypothetical protein